MNSFLPRFLKKAYYKEPISAFILIVGVVDALIGGFNERWTLLSLGLVLVFSSAVMRWLQSQKINNSISQQPPRRYLPPNSGQNALPVLKSKKHHS